jgi:hypothetical protein
MNNPYDIHSWTKLYREEWLQEVAARRLEGRLRVARSEPPENHKKGGGEVNEEALRIRIAALVVAVFLSATGATLATSALAGEDLTASAEVAQDLGVSVANTGNVANAS